MNVLQKQLNLSSAGAPALAVFIFLLGFSNVALAKEKKPTSVESQLRFKEGDENGNDLKALKTEMLVIRSEKRALEQLQKLAIKYRGTRLEPEMLFRLAELYMRRARSERFFEVHKYSDQVVSFAPELVKDANEAKEIKKAIEIYDRIMAVFPEFHSMDTVIFNNAYARQQTGDEKGAEARYEIIVKKYPDSQLVPDSWLALGEISYQRRHFQVALERFQAIRKFPMARVYAYGLYKSGWCLYNLQDAKQAMAQLEEVVAFGREIAKTERDVKLDLRREALGDLVLFFGDVFPSSKAIEYFTAQAVGLDASVFILKLNELYKRHSRFADVEVILKEFIAKLPDSEGVAAAHEELVWNYEKVKQRPQAVAFMAVFEKYCAKRQSVEVAHLPDPKMAATHRSACLDRIADTSQKLGAKWHATWKERTPSPELAQAAETAYQIYLRHGLVGSEEYKLTSFNLAELLFQQRKFRLSSDQYELVAISKPDAKIWHAAAYGAIVALEKAIEVQNGEKSDAKWSDTDELRFRKLADFYQRNFPQGEFLVELKFKRAFIAYEKERYDEAAPQFKAIGWASGDAPAAQLARVSKAQDLYLDILNIKKDYKGLREAAGLLMKKGLTTDRQGVVEKIYREAYFAEIQVQEDKGDVKGAISSYKKFALENTSSELAQKAWWNASQLEFRSGDAESGAKTCYQMHKLFPTAANAKDCLTRAAQTFEAMGRLELAARVLLNLALVEETKQEKWRELAADFFALSGSRDRANQMYLKLAEGKKPEQALVFHQKMLVLAKESGDHKLVKEIRVKLASQNIEPYAGEFVVEQAEQEFADGEMAKAFATAKKVVGKDSISKNLQARARMVQALVLEDEFKRQSTKARVDRLALVLQIKTEKLEKAQKGFQAAISYGDPETTIRASRALSTCYSHYAQSVREIQLPAETTAEERESFAREMESLAIPMEEKGIDAIAQALEAAKKFGLRDGIIADLQDQLNQMNMKPAFKSRPVVTNPAIMVPQFPVSTAQRGPR